jgi:gp16 family phage-associated protein
MVTSPQPKMKEVRATLVLRGTSFTAFCRDHGFVRQAVSFALTGARKGKRAKKLAEEFLSKLQELE